MWFNKPLNSFLNLGICKEYPNMARSKSISGGKTVSKEQTGVSNPASVPETKTVSAETAPSRMAPEVRKLAVVKGESRKNIVPINLEDEIRRRAYELYEQRGSGSGSEAEDWLAAEREVMQRYHQQSA
jgi:DUF2934 family protein